MNNQLPEVNIETFAGAHAEGVFVLDVRQPHEFTEARVPGAVALPMGQVIERIAEVPIDKRVYVVCAVGGRSAQVTQYLVAHGFDAVNVAGGTNAWVDSGRPFEQG